MKLNLLATPKASQKHRKLAVQYVFSEQQQQAKNRSRLILTVVRLFALPNPRRKRWDGDRSCCSGSGGVTLLHSLYLMMPERVRSSAGFTATVRRRGDTVHTKFAVELKGWINVGQQSNLRVFFYFLVYRYFKVGFIAKPCFFLAVAHIHSGMWSRRRRRRAGRSFAGLSVCLSWRRRSGESAISWRDGCSPNKMLQKFVEEMLREGQGCHGPIHDYYNHNDIRRPRLD